MIFDMSRHSSRLNATVTLRCRDYNVLRSKGHTSALLARWHVLTTREPFRWFFRWVLQRYESFGIVVSKDDLLRERLVLIYWLLLYSLSPRRRLEVILNRDDVSSWWLGSRRRLGITRVARFVLLYFIIFYLLSSRRRLEVILSRDDVSSWWLGSRRRLGITRVAKFVFFFVFCSYIYIYISQSRDAYIMP